MELNHLREFYRRENPRFPIMIPAKKVGLHGVPVVSPLECLSKTGLERERITITKHGAPVAVLAPHDPAQTVDVKAVIEEIRAFRKKRRLGDDTSIREMIEEGRR